MIAPRWCVGIAAQPIKTGTRKTCAYLALKFQASVNGLSRASLIA